MYSEPFASTCFEHFDSESKEQQTFNTERWMYRKSYFKDGLTKKQKNCDVKIILKMSFEVYI